MATPSSSTSKAKGDSQNLARSKSNIGRKPKLPSSVSSEEGSSDQKPEKPLPNYLKPTISSRPDPVKFVKKNNNSVEDNQKLLRRRSFDRPPSSLTSPSTSSTRTPKPLNVSPSRSRDRPAVPKEKPVLPQRSSSFGGSRGVPRGASSVKAPSVAPKKSGLSSSSSSLKSKKEGSTIKKASEKEIPLDTASLSSAHEEEEEVIKVESDHVQVPNEIEEPKEETKETKEVQVEVVEAVESGEEIESGVPTNVVPPVVEDCVAVVVPKEDEKIIINEVKTEEKVEETKEQENDQDNKGQEEEDVKKNIDEVETPKKKEVESVEETTEEKVEEVKEEENEKVQDEVVTKEKEEEEVKEEKKEEVKDEKKVEEEKEKAKEEEKKKKEVVKGKKESPSAYNDVIASKMQENPRKNKVLALAGAFQTVIDYETAASK